MGSIYCGLKFCPGGVLRVEILKNILPPGFSTSPDPQWMKRELITGKGKEREVIAEGKGNVE